MIKAFPKIFAIGTDYIRDIFNEEIEITEKIDGSQFIFGKIDGDLYTRSKGQQIFPESVDKMFDLAVEYVLKIQDKIPDNTVFYCEYLKNPKHNTLKYNRVPKNNLILFGVADSSEMFYSYDKIKEWADILDIEVVPLIFNGKIENAVEIFDLIKKESILGGVDMEGLVVKNYYRQFLLGGQPMPLMAGKYVSEKFKEVHRESWGKEQTARGRFQVFKDSFRTEARWEKSIQHLRDSGELENSPRDIGKLIKAVKDDIATEEKEAIKNFLYSEFSSEIYRFATGGLPEYYKQKLAERSFNEL